MSTDAKTTKTYNLTFIIVTQCLLQVTDCGFYIHWCLDLSTLEVYAAAAILDSAGSIRRKEYNCQL